MDKFFDIVIEKDRLTAKIVLKGDAPIDVEMKTGAIQEFLAEKGIIFGINEEMVSLIERDVYGVDYPLVIAEGEQPVKGIDGYLVDRTVAEEKEQNEKYENKSLNLRNIMNINSVKSGQLIAEIIPPTHGIVGTSIFGEVIPASDGKPLKLRAGKNVIYHMDKAFATIDGQVSIMPNSVNVLPVFRVGGDLDLNTGNIDFIGNVVIDGNVPTGYTIRAGGDIKVTGLVEGAELIARGSILITGGIAAGGRGSIEAGVSLFCNYLNQANCKVGQDVTVDSSILHSTIECDGKVVSRKGHIIGGKITALKSIAANEVGNQHYAPTHLYIGDLQKLIERELQLQKEIDETERVIDKLNLLEEQLNARMVVKGEMSTKDKLLLQKQRITLKPLKQKVGSLEVELTALREELAEKQEVYLQVSKTIFPNVQVHFGKYSKSIETQQKGVKIYYDRGEIVSVPL